MCLQAIHSWLTSLDAALKLTRAGESIAWKHYGILFSRLIIDDIIFVSEPMIVMDYISYRSNKQVIAWNRKIHCIGLSTALQYLAPVESSQQHLDHLLLLSGFCSIAPSLSESFSFLWRIKLFSSQFIN